MLGADVMVGAGEGRLDVAERGVHPAALGGSDREASAVSDGAGVKGTHLAALAPEPVTIGRWLQPADPTQNLGNARIWHGDLGELETTERLNIRTGRITIAASM